jgi:predicted Zn finger-like uncharacterized protein
MIITCPHCQTRYQVAFEAIGSAGRKVQCAHCNRAWQEMRPEPQEADADDKLFDSMAEEGLDAAIAAEEQRIAAAAAERAATLDQEGAGTLDPALIRRRQRAFTRRQNTMFAQLPLSRVRRMARVIGAVALVGIVAFGYFGRTQVVEQFPAMAGIYEAMGLGVNVVGLDFAAVNTLRTLRDGKEVLMVSAEIVGLNPDPVTVPPVIVTLLDDAGEGIYEWSVTPNVRDLAAGESAAIQTRLTLPPGDASRVRLSFTGGHGGAGALAGSDKPPVPADPPPPPPTPRGGQP